MNEGGGEPKHHRESQGGGGESEMGQTGVMMFLNSPYVVFPYYLETPGKASILVSHYETV